MVDFHNFQKHRRSSLPKLLQGENPMSLATQQTKTHNPEVGSSSKQEAPENSEKYEISTQKKDILKTEVSDDQAKDQPERLTKQGEDRPLSSPDKSTTDETGEQLSTKIDNPIQIVTPLQSTRGKPNAEVILIGYLTPISIEEIPPSDFFLSKKRKVAVKKEMHQNEGATIKKHRVLLHGKNLEDEDFATEVADSLGAFSTTNLFSIDNLKERLKQRNKMISQLQNQLRNAKSNVREEVNKGMEQTRANDKQEIQLLKSSLDEMHKKMQVSER
jgi:hypothetical protein